MTGRHRSFTRSIKKGRVVMSLLSKTRIDKRFRHLFAHPPSHFPCRSRGLLAMSSSKKPSRQASQAGTHALRLVVRPSFSFYLPFIHFLNSFSLSLHHPHWVHSPICSCFQTLVPQSFVHLRRSQPADSVSFPLCLLLACFVFVVCSFANGIFPLLRSASAFLIRTFALQC